MDYYLTAKPYDPFVAFFSSQAGQQVKSIIIRNFGEKTIAKQISKLVSADSDANIVFSTELTELLNTSNMYERLSHNLENDYSIGPLKEEEGSHLRIYPVCI